MAIAGIGVPQESVLLAMAIEEKDHIIWLSWMSSQQAIVEAGPQPVMHINFVIHLSPSANFRLQLFFSLLEIEQKFQSFMQDRNAITVN